MVTIMGIAAILVPLTQNVNQYYGNQFMLGMGSGAWDSGNSLWLIEMWKDKVPPVFQIQAMMYGVGSIIAPLVVSPFVLGDLTNGTTDNTTGSPELTTFLSVINTTIVISNNNPSDDNINYSVDRRPKLRIPFLISGLLTLPGEFECFLCG